MGAKSDIWEYLIAGSITFAFCGPLVMLFIFTIKDLRKIRAAKKGLKPH